MKNKEACNAAHSAYAAMMGIRINTSNLLSIDKMRNLLKGNEYGQKICEKYFDGNWEDYFNHHDTIYDLIYLLKSNIDIFEITNNYICVGLFVTSMGEDETLREFRQRASDTILEVLGYNVEKINMKWCNYKIEK